MRARRPSVLLLTAALSALVLTACGDGGGTAASRITADPSAAAGAELPTEGGSGSVVIASANFPENQILAEIYRQALEGAGYDASVTPLTTRPNIVAALESDDIQVEPDYVGSLTEFLNREANGPDAPRAASGDLDATYAKAQELAAGKGLTVLPPSPAQDQNAFAVTREFSEEHGVTRLSDLEDFEGPLVLGATPECKTYSLCQPGLEETYGITFTGFEQTDLGGTLSVSKLQDGTVQLGEFLSSDGGVKANDFVVLEDDRNLQSVDNVVPVISESVADDDLLREILERISAAMTTDDLIALNAAVSIDRKLPAQAATDFLEGKGLVASS